MRKFKAGDKIIHLDDNQIKESEVKGVIIIQGEVEFKYDKFKSEEGKTKTIYMLNAYSFVEQSKAFRTKSGLFRYLSEKLNQEEELNF